MNREPSRNLAASVRHRLLEQARKEGRPFQELAQYYAMERFLYRLSCSPQADRFILKGAVLMKVWSCQETRPTRDIDLLGRTGNGEEELVNRVTEILACDVPPDGLVFGLDRITSERITENAEYEGIRIWFEAGLDTVRLKMQLDIGFGDIVHPGPQELELPTLLNQPVPRLLCYTRESMIAEKFEAMVRFGHINSRMKDFYDVWLLSRCFDFEGVKLSEAVRKTFEQRKTVLPAKIVAFSPSFAAEKQSQWQAFRKRIRQESTPAHLREIVSDLEGFLLPVATSIGLGSYLVARWPAPGPWC